MGAVLGRTSSQQSPRTPFALHKDAEHKFFAQNESDESSSSALIHAVESEGNADMEETLGTTEVKNTWVGASNMLCCFTSGNNLQSSLGSSTIGSMLWQTTSGFRFLAGTINAPLLPPSTPEMQDRVTVVLDLDETLLHSSFVPVKNADFVASVPVEGEPTDVWVIKRPHLEYFLQQLANHFEVVVFTASLATYADVVMDIIDPGIRAMAEPSYSGTRPKSRYQSREDAPPAKCLGSSGQYHLQSSLDQHTHECTPSHESNCLGNPSPETLQAASEVFANSGALTCSPVVIGSPDASTSTEAFRNTPSALEGNNACTSATSCHNHPNLVPNKDESSSGAGSGVHGVCTTESAVHYRLYRNHCSRNNGSYIKDLTKLGRSMARTVIVDNSPVSYMWNPENALPSVTYIDDLSDNGLLKILEVLMYLKDSSDVRKDLPLARSAAGYDVHLC